MKSFYKLLNLNENAEQEEIRKAFRKLAKRYHPDISHNNEKFVEILNAYKALMENITPEDGTKPCEHPESNEKVIKRTLNKIIIPENRVSFALSLQDVALMGIFNRGKTKRRSGYYNPKGYDVTVFLTSSELKNGAVVFIRIPAHVICPLCRGDRKRCNLCSDRGYILKAVPVEVHIPKDIQDGEIFPFPLKKRRGAGYAYFMKKELTVKISIISFDK